MTINTAANVAGTNLTLTSITGNVTVSPSLSLATLNATANVAAGTITLPANITTTATSGNTQVYTGKVVLPSNVTLDATNSQSAGVNGNIKINNGVTSSAAGTTLTLVDGGGTGSSISGGVTDGGGTTALTLNSGVLTLNGANASTYSGQTTITSGTVLKAVTANATSANSSVNISGTLDLNGHSTAIGGIITSSGTVTNGVASAAALTVSASGTFNGVIQDGVGATSLNVSSGTLTLGGANTYSGNTTIAAGATLTFGAGGSVSSTTNVAANGNFDLAGTNQSIGALSGAATGQVFNSSTAADSVLTVNGTGVFAGVISDVGASVGTHKLALSLQNANNTLTLSGLNTYSGNTTINSTCTILAGAANATSPNSDVTVSGTIDLHGNNTAIRGLSGTGSITNNQSASTGILTVSGGGTFTGAIQDNGTGKAGLSVPSGTLALNTGTFNYTGGTSVSSTGTLTLTSPPASFTIGSLSISGGAFNGAGTVNVSSVNQTGGVLTSTSGTMNVSGDFSHTAGTFTHNGGEVVLTGAVPHAITGSTTFNNFTDTTGGSSLTFAAGSTTTVAGTLNLTGASGSLVTLRSSTPGTFWNINPPTRNVSFVDVQDSNNTDTTAISPANSVDSGNNVNWIFTSPPIITSANAATFTTGVLGSFTVTATGVPAPTFSLTGAPSWVSINSSTGVITGTPPNPGSGPNTFAFTVTASNGVSPDTTQSFTLTVVAPPAITSANATTFTIGVSGSFTVTATGVPAPTFSLTGAPSWVSINGSTGVITGTPPNPGSGPNTFAFTVTASNGVNPAATQNFTLTVVTPPVITSANATTFIVGVSGSFTVIATGVPAPTFSLAGAPSWVSINSATGVITGSPPNPGSGSNTFAFTVTASNGVSPDATQNFTLTVVVPPAITSANATTFTAGALGSFTVTATGVPAPAFSLTGAPSWISINSVTGVLSGTPPNPGSFAFSVNASNGVNPAATQNFTLTVPVSSPATPPPPTVSSPPVVTPNTGLVTGQAAQFTASASSTVTLTYTWNFGDGATATGSTVSHSFTSPGIYTVMVTATDTIGQSAMQTVTVTVTVKTIPFQLTTARILLNSGKDQAEIKGIIHIPAGIAFATTPFTVNVGGNIESFTFKNSLLARSGANSFSIDARINIVDTIAHDATFTLRLAGDLGTEFKANLPLDAKGYPTQVPVQIQFNGIYNGLTLPTTFKPRHPGALAIVKK